MNMFHMLKNGLVVIFSVMVVSAVASEKSTEMDALAEELRQATVSMIVNNLVATVEGNIDKWQTHPHYGEAQQAAVEKLKKELLAAATTKNKVDVRRLKRHPYYAEVHDKLVSELAKLEASHDDVENILKYLGTPVTRRVGSAKSNGDH